MALDIKPQEIASRKEIGHLDGNPVYQISLKGGLFIIATPNGPSVKILGSGPHQVVAKHVAKKMHPKLIITELLKSEELNYNTYARLVPYYVNMVDKLNQVANG